jgi:hypothetical protein
MTAFRGLIALLITAGIFAPADFAQAAEYRLLFVPEPAAQPGSPTVDTLQAQALFTLPPSDYSGSNYFNSQTTYYIIAVDLFTGQVVPDADIQLTLTAYPNGGGHDHHDARRPAGTYDRYQGSTGRDGWQFKVTYTAPEVSGTIQTRGTCTVPNGICYGGVFTTDVKIDGLAPMPNGLNYDLVGSWGMPGVSSQHIGNHYAAPSFAGKRVYLADLYTLQYLGRLKYNDISLQWGGLFDIYNNWRPDHWEHRRGISADVAFVPEDRREDFFAFLQEARITGRITTHANHWHIREYGSTN